MMILSAAFYALYRGLEYALGGNHKLAVNYVSFLNTSAAIAISSASILEIVPYGTLQWWLTSYFAYDSFVILRKLFVSGSFRRIRALDAIFLLHHGISMATLHQAEHAWLLSRLMLTVEVSNFPMYIVKHYIEHSDAPKVRLWRKIQFAVYAPLRIFVVGAFFLVDGAFFIKAMGLPVYVMGLVWSWKLYNNLS